MSPRRATTKAIIAKGMLNVARFLLGAGASVISGFFAGGITGAGAAGETCTTIGGGSGAALAAGVRTVVGAGVATGAGSGSVGAAVARTGFGGKFSFGSFSKGAETDPSSALGDGESVFISSRNFLSPLNESSYHCLLNLFFY